MAHRHRAAVDVQALVVDPKLAHRRHGHAGEGFVDLEKIDVIDRPADLLEELLSPRPDIGPGQTWQTRNDLQKDPAFAEFIALVREAVDGVIQFLEIEPLPYEVTGCWGNVNPPGAPA